MNINKFVAAMGTTFYELGKQAAQREHELQADVEHWRAVAEDMAMELHERPFIFGAADVAVVKDEADNNWQPTPSGCATEFKQPTAQYKSKRGEDWLYFANIFEKDLAHNSIIDYNGDIDGSVNKMLTIASRGFKETWDMMNFYAWLRHAYSNLFQDKPENLVGAVLEHIEHYTVPQYGDAPNDQAETWTSQDCSKAIVKYLNRFNTNQRGIEERKRDILKMAHYLQMYFSKY